VVLVAAIAWAIEPAAPFFCCYYFAGVGVAINLIVAIVVFVDSVTEMGPKPSDTAENVARKPRGCRAAEIDATMASVALGLLGCRLAWLIARNRGG
jgi:hypothetical protein